MHRYKLLIIKIFLFLFIFDKSLYVLNYIFNLSNANIGGTFDVLSLPLIIFIALPFTIIIVNFLTNE